MGRKLLGTLRQLSCQALLMPRAYSQDLREKAIAAMDRGVAKHEVITMFNISRDSLDRWLKQRSDTGEFQAVQGYQHGHSHRIVDWEKFCAFVKQHGDKTQAELAELWHAPVSARTISRALAKIEFTRKKRPTAIVNAMP